MRGPSADVVEIEPAAGHAMLGGKVKLRLNSGLPASRINCSKDWFVMHFVTSRSKVRATVVTFNAPVGLSDFAA